MKLEGKKVIVFAANEYEDLEAWYPILRLKEEGAEVTIVGWDNGCTECESKHGYPIKIDKKAKDIDTDNYDAAIVPGGYAPDRLRRCKNVQRIVKEMNEANKVIASICHGGWVLVSADILDGVKMTSTPAIKDDLINAGAEWVNEEVVVDGNLVTSRAPQDLPVFMKTIIDMIDKKHN
ncbi:MAG: type 1 glutamine amidotransferase domain-containing protein [Bacillota bacterium]